VKLEPANLLGNLEGVEVRVVTPVDMAVRESDTPLPRGDVERLCLPGCALGTSSHLLENRPSPTGTLLEGAATDAVDHALRGARAG